MLTTVTARIAMDVTVHTELLVGGAESNTFVVLVGQDRIYAEADGVRVEMQAVEEGVYEATFAAGQEGAEYSVALMRGIEGEDRDAYTRDALGNRGTLPAPFELESSAESSAVSRATQELELTWSPSGTSDAMQLDVDDEAGGCIFADQFELPGDAGEYVLEAGSIEATSTTDPQTCEVIATLIRERTGATDPALDPESWFRLRQLRELSFTSAP